jgi:hypothetical protein
MLFRSWDYWYWRVLASGAAHQRARLPEKALLGKEKLVGGEFEY